MDNPDKQDFILLEIRRLKSKGIKVDGVGMQLHAALDGPSAKQVENAIVKFRFHDLRHEAISRFFELGLNIPEVAVISGHKDPRMLFRYTHLRARSILRKLDQIDAHG